MSIKVIILEDNPITAADLKEILAERGIDVLCIFNSAEVALKNFLAFEPDILLVDIYLNGEMTGVDFVKQIRKHIKVPVIYLTANTENEIVQEALETKPSAFLSKPYKEKDVQIAIELAFAETIVHSPSAEDQSIETSHVFLKSGNRFEKVMLADLQYLQADGSYCRFFTQKDQYMLTANLSNYQDFLERKGFVRIHRSYMVNINAIDKMNNDYVFIGSTTLPIGRSYKQLIKDTIPKLS